MLGVVAGDILPVAGEFDGESGLGRFVCTGQIANHQALRFDMPVGDVAEYFRIEIA